MHVVIKFPTASHFAIGASAPHERQPVFFPKLDLRFGVRQLSSQKNIFRWKFQDLFRSKNFVKFSGLIFWNVQCRQNPGSFWEKKGRSRKARPWKKYFVKMVKLEIWKRKALGIVGIVWSAFPSALWVSTHHEVASFRTPPAACSPTITTRAVSSSSALIKEPLTEVRGAP